MHLLTSVYASLASVACMLLFIHDPRANRNWVRTSRSLNTPSRRMCPITRRQAGRLMSARKSCAGGGGVVR